MARRKRRSQIFLLNVHNAEATFEFCSSLKLSSLAPQPKPGRRKIHRCGARHDSGYGIGGFERTRTEVTEQKSGELFELPITEATEAIRKTWNVSCSSRVASPRSFCKLLIPARHRRVFELSSAGQKRYTCHRILTSGPFPLLLRSSRIPAHLPHTQLA